MSYAVHAPLTSEPRRPATPVTVTFAASLLAVMAVVGLGYAVAGLAIVPGVVSRFRAGGGGAAAADADGLVFLVWAEAGFAAVLAVLLIGLYAALALGLRRGSNAARVATWVVCAVGLFAGCGSAITVLAQRGSGAAVVSSLGDAYPSFWMGLNISLAVAQTLGYLAVAGLLVASPGHFFFGGGAAPPGPAAAQGAYGNYGSLPGMPGLYQNPPPTGPPSLAGIPPGPYGGPYAGPPAGPYVAHGGDPASPYSRPVSGPYGGAPGPYGGYPHADPYQSGAPGHGPGNPAAAPGSGAGGSPAEPYAGGTPAPGDRPSEPGPDDGFWTRPSP